MKNLVVGMFSVGLLFPAVGQSGDFDNAVKEVQKEAKKIEKGLSIAQQQAIEVLKQNECQSINPCALNPRLCNEIP